jgi:hypothetical protein
MTKDQYPTGEWRMWYVLKIDYEYPAGADKQSKLVVYPEFKKAQLALDRLKLSYQLNAPIRVKNDKMIRITGAWLYESFKEEYWRALDAVESDDGMLMDEARAVEIDIDQ